jgi:Spy/CpxP family protein refolding chaperone
VGVLLFTSGDARHIRLTHRTRYDLFFAGEHTVKLNMKKIVLSIVAPAMATLFVAAASWSLPQGDGERPDPQHRITHLSKMLELTDEQEATVQTLMTSSFEESEADRERLRELRDQLKEQAASFDAATVQATADEIGQITSRMVYRRAYDRAQIYQLLDDEQRVMMAEMAEHRREHGGKRGGHRDAPF